MNPTVYHFCTYFDVNYLTRGLALYESLRLHCRKPFILWVLCFDQDTFNILARLSLPDIRLIAQSDFERDDAALVATKATRSRVEYYWTCTPILPNYVLRHHPEVDVITYLDADLYFYSDPQPIFQEMGEHSILIHEHRYAPEYAHLAKTSGVYNVGWVSFRRDTAGLACLAWWRDRCLEWCYTRYDAGRFGDQLYLDDWLERFDGVAVLQHKGAGLAPWNLIRHRLELRNRRLFADGWPLIFFHFHGFRCVHECAVKPADYDYRIPWIATEHVYRPYAAKLSVLSKEEGLPFVDAGQVVERHILLTGLLEQRLLLLQPILLSQALWYLTGWRRRNEDRVANGFAAHQRGDILTMRRLFFQAILRDPSVLANIGIASLLVESFVGAPAMKRYRSWRRKDSRSATNP